jgi:hypothetical protein
VLAGRLAAGSPCWGTGARLPRRDGHAACGTAASATAADRR